MTVPLISQLIDCPYQISDINKHTFYIKKGSSQESFYVFDRAQMKPVTPDPWNEEYYKNKAIGDVIAPFTSYCGLYAKSGSATIELYTETEFKTGEIVKSESFLLNLTAAHIAWCRNKALFTPVGVSAF